MNCFFHIKNHFRVMKVIQLLMVFSFLFVTQAQFCQMSGDSLYIEFVGKPEIIRDGSELSDTLTLKFNLYKNKGAENEVRKLFINESEILDIAVSEYVGEKKTFKAPTYIPGSLKKLNKGEAVEGSIPSDITISLLIDRSGSIDEQEMAKIKIAVKAFVDNVPKGCLYFSWFHDDISSSILLTEDNFEDADFTISNKNTALYNAIYTKLLEFDPTTVLPNLMFEPELEKNNEIAKRNSINNFLIILTDGKDDTKNIAKYSEPDMTEIFFSTLFGELSKTENKVKVYTLGFGENSNDFEEEKLKKISKASGNPKGYFLAKPDSIFQLLKERITDEIKPDYQIKLKNPKDKTYQGYERNLTLEITDPDSKHGKAVGSVPYGLGSTTQPLTVGKGSIWGKMLIGLIAGLIFLLVVMIIIQLIIPLIKNQIFTIKYVKKYKPAENEIRKECPYCGDPINKGDPIVVKCKHIVHKVCWGDFGHVCPEYGQNCNDGKQDYFDITDPFSTKNKIYYLKWVFYGLIGGFITWLFFLLLKDTGLIKNIAYKTLKWISPNISDESIINLFIDKISPLMLIGILMGLFLTFFFAYVEEFRRKTMIIMSHILLRGVVGGFVGFLSFYIGCIILILLKQYHTSYAFDWIPWVIFGSSLGLVLSVKSTIVWKHGVIGGLIAIIFAFIVLFFMVRDLGYQALLIGFMLYGAGLGFSISTVRSAAEQYFLKIIEGKKHEETIPVHKWMSFQGGHNEVYIGAGFSCEIQMNWEKNNPEIADRHAKMYINTSRNIPVIVSIENEKLTTYDERIEMEPGKEYDLFSGNTFRIGNTLFQYYEKDKSN